MILILPESCAHQPLRILAQLDKHFAADDCSPADADRWRELKRHIVKTLSTWRG